jgi:hypothetical protein
VLAGAGKSLIDRSNGCTFVIASVPERPTKIHLGNVGLRASENPVAAGVLSPGEGWRGELTLENLSKSPITAERIEMSCPCLRANSLPVTIGPRDSGSIPLAFDPKNNVDFRGKLSSDLRVLDSAGLVVFRGRVELEVRDSALDKGKSVELR